MNGICADIEILPATEDKASQGQNTEAYNKLIAQIFTQTTADVKSSNKEEMSLKVSRSASTGTGISSEKSNRVDGEYLSPQPPPPQAGLTSSAFAILATSSSLIGGGRPKSPVPPFPRTKVDQDRQEVKDQTSKVGIGKIGLLHLWVLPLFFL
jgi:hypothetical protein